MVLPCLPFSASLHVEIRSCFSWESRRSPLSWWITSRILYQKRLAEVDNESMTVHVWDLCFSVFNLYIGFGSGVNKWILHLQGGGWCYDKNDCLKWSKTDLGSSKNWPQKAPYTYLNSGLLSYLKSKNPDFYEWNVVHVQYCDGASYSGYV